MVSREGKIVLLVVVLGFAAVPAFSYVDQMGPDDTTDETTDHCVRIDHESNTTTCLSEADPSFDPGTLHVTSASDGPVPSNATVLTANETAVQDMPVLTETITEAAETNETAETQLTADEYEQFTTLTNAISKTSESGGVYVRHDGRLYHAYTVHNV